MILRDCPRPGEGAKVAVVYGDIDTALRQLKRQTERAGIPAALRRHAVALSRGQRRRRKSRAAQRVRQRRAARRAALAGTTGDRK